MTVLNMDNVVNGTAVDYGLDNYQQVTINPGIVIGSTGGADAIVSAKNQSSLDNFGTVFSFKTPGVPAIDFSGAGASIINEIGGTITGYIGVELENSGTIDNLGSIFGAKSGFGSTGVWMLGSNDELTNSGSIAGAYSGVATQSTGSVTIHNYGSISSDNYAISIYSPNAEVTNAKGATITGNGPGAYSIFVGGGSLDLHNAGTLNGDLACANFGPNTIVNTGKIHGNVYLSAETVFNGKHGSSGDIFTGKGLETVLVGKGKTAIHIHDAGHATLTAGAGQDKFVFDDGLGGGNILIKHFSTGVDKIELSEMLFKGLGPHGTLKASHFAIDAPHNGSPEIVYDEHNGFLYYDANGVHTHFATLAGHPPVSALSFMLEA